MHNYGLFACFQLGGILQLLRIRDLSPLISSVSLAPGLLLAEVIGNYLSPLRTALLLWERVNRSLRVLELPIRGGCLIRGGGKGRTRSLPLLPLSTPTTTTTHRLLKAGSGEDTFYREPLPSRVPIARVLIFFSRELRLTG